MNEEIMRRARDCGIGFTKCADGTTVFSGTDRQLQAFHDAAVEKGRNQVPDAGKVIPEGYKVVPIVPAESQWSGLARDIVFWFDLTDKRTPRSLFEHLYQLGRMIPDWLRNEPELLTLDSAISKGTRAVIIYKAMLDSAPPAPLSASNEPAIKEPILLSYAPDLSTCTLIVNNMAVYFNRDKKYE